jgi:hypothetical protein
MAQPFFTPQDTSFLTIWSVPSGGNLLYDEDGEPAALNDASRISPQRTRAKGEKEYATNHVDVFIH